MPGWRKSAAGRWFSSQGISASTIVNGCKTIRVFHFYPVPFLICLAIISLVFFKARQHSPFYRFVLVCFSLYLLLLIGYIFFPIMVPFNWPHNLSRAEMKSALEQINLIPLRNTGILDAEPLSQTGIRDIFINFLMTLPAGIALPYLLSSRFWFMILSSLIIGIFFESVELAVKLATGTFYHTVDINDVIMNALGVFTGYLVFSIMRWINQKMRI